MKFLLRILVIIIRPKGLWLFKETYSVWGRIDSTYLRIPLPIPQDFSHSSRVSAFAHECIFSWADCPHVTIFNCGTSTRVTRSILDVAVPSATIHLNCSLVNKLIYCIMPFCSGRNVDTHRSTMIEMHPLETLSLIIFRAYNFYSIQLNQFQNF